MKKYIEILNKKYGYNLSISRWKWYKLIDNFRRDCFNRNKKFCLEFDFKQDLILYLEKMIEYNETWNKEYFENLNSLWKYKYIDDFVKLARNE